MTTYQGSCHCGNVAFEADGEITQVLQCNCTICRKRGHLLWFVPKTQFRLKTPDGNASTYRFNTMKIAHRFCPVCGIGPYSESAAPDGTPTAAVNVRCVDGVDLATLKVIEYDGLHK